MGNTFKDGQRRDRPGRTATRKGADDSGKKIIPTLPCGDWVEIFR